MFRLMLLLLPFQMVSEMMQVESEMKGKSKFEYILIADQIILKMYIKNTYIQFNADRINSLFTAMVLAVSFSVMRLSGVFGNFGGFGMTC